MKAKAHSAPIQEPLLASAWANDRPDADPAAALLLRVELSPGQSATPDFHTAQTTTPQGGAK